MSKTNETAQTSVSRNVSTEAGARRWDLIDRAAERAPRTVEETRVREGQESSDRREK
jgi:hypothetical protein